MTLNRVFDRDGRVPWSGGGTGPAPPASGLYVDDDDSHVEYEGYMIDLLRLISSMVGFRYRIVPALDSNFGYPLPDGSWNGIIGEVIRKVHYDWLHS